MRPPVQAFLATLGMVTLVAMPGSIILLGIYGIYKFVRRGV